MSLSVGSSAVRVLHAALLGIAAAVFAAELSLASGVVAAGLGALLGSLLAERLHAARYRLAAMLGFAAAALLLGGLVTQLVLDSAAFARALGPTHAMSVGEVSRWSTAALAVAFALRACALRFRVALAIEGSIAVLVVASVVAAHRDGMIARPLEISDWFWRQGIDPVVAFLGVGVAAAILLAGVLASGRSGRRTLVQLIAVLVLGGLVAAYLHDEPLDEDPRDPTGKKLNKDEDDPRAGPASAGSGSAADGKGGHPAELEALPPPPPQQGGRNRPTAIVVFSRDVMPFGEVYYFRHAAFSQFNGARLVEATTGLDPDARYARVGTQQVEGAPVGSFARAVVSTDVAILSEHSRTFALIDAARIEPRPNPEPARFRRAYRALSWVPTATVSLGDLLELEPGGADWDDAAWRHYTELPHDERYHDLARRLQSELRPEYRSDPVALAFAVKQHLEQTTIYSFQRKYVGADPTGQFLFSEDKRGYCVHLAHAGAYLLRALGIPTRVSAGYAVPAKNLGRGSALLIKDGDAHAWAEIYLRGVGWLPIEITPEQTDIQPAPFQEHDLQQLLGEMARKQGRFDRAPPAASQWLKVILRVLGWVPHALLGLLLLGLVFKVWRLLRPALEGAPSPRIAYRGASDLLAAVGLVRRRGESREGFARRVASTAPSFEPLTRVLVASALGSRTPEVAAEGRPLSVWYLQVVQQVRAGVPGWRLWLGLLNPLSWLWSR